MNLSLALQLEPSIAAPENSRSLFAPSRRPKDSFRSKQKSSMVVLNKGVDPFTELQVQQVMERQSKSFIPTKQTSFHPNLVEQAYESCRKICAQQSTTYYLGSLLMNEERKKAIWAVYGM
ncbi:Phytoene synthase chloroplastic [Bienertia sinuspersici]